MTSTHTLNQHWPGIGVVAWENGRVIAVHPHVRYKTVVPRYAPGMSVYNRAKDQTYHVIRVSDQYVTYRSAKGTGSTKTTRERFERLITDYVEER